MNEEQKEKLYEQFPIYNYLSIGFQMETHETCKILLKLGVSQKQISKWTRKNILEFNFYNTLDEKGYSIVRDNDDKIVVIKTIDKYGVNEEDYFYELGIGKLNKEINEFSESLEIDISRIKIYTGNGKYI